MKEATIYLNGNNGSNHKVLFEKFAACSTGQIQLIVGNDLVALIPASALIIIKNENIDTKQSIWTTI